MTDYFYAGGGIGLGPSAPKPAADPYPAPEVSSRHGLPAPGPAKKAVADLASMGLDWGYSVHIQYARGCFPHASLGTPGEPKDSLGIVMERGIIRAVAVYAGSGNSWSWGTLAVQVPGAWPERFASLTSFLDGLFGPVHQPVKAAGPMLGPARRALKIWGPLLP